MNREFLYILLPALIGGLFAYYYWYWNSEEEDDEEK